MVSRLHSGRSQVEQGKNIKGDISVRLQSIVLGAGYGFILSLFMTTVVAAWVAYDNGQATERFYALLGGFVAVLAAPLIGRYSSRRTTIRLLGGTALLITALVSAFYLWQGFGAVHLWTGFLQEQSFVLNDNLAAQILIMTLPVVVATLWIAIGCRHKLLSLLIGALLGVGAIALVMTQSRGAFLGLCVAGGMVGYGWLREALSRRYQSRWLWLLDGAIWVSAVGVALVYVALVVSPRLDAQLGLQDESALSRLSLWRSSLPLIADYYFTGSGLGTAVMVYATYAYLVHVPYLYHAHNLYLHLALEQGMVGLLAWLGLITATVLYTIGALRTAERTMRIFLFGGLFAMYAFLVHSLFEAELFYSSLGALVFFAPAALLWSASTAYEAALKGIQPVYFSSALVGAGALAGLTMPLLLAILVSGGSARWEANLGAVLQTQVELGTYRRPPWSFQDEVRRYLGAELRPAEGYFEAALALDPLQPTAHRRLGAIALAQGAFARAKEHLLAAYAADPHDRATRQMLGELYALEGDVDASVRMWQELDLSQGQLMVREWWYQAFGEPEQLERVNNAIRAYQRLR